MATKTTAGPNKQSSVRFDQPEEEFLRRAKKATGLSKREIIRRACRFALPKFLSGQVDIMKLR